ncbi:MAG: L-lactate permease [Corynebacterium sp.]|uniref:L-lactate permease n=1 Tax=Corynebacterium sp. TaxID=1720 RepID=UPI002647DB72|nr:L-lactate permease [Corynebacterium sp.]MDN5581306.1 L-lactate permease [Corynebacterium sp.]MDN5720769.1 L-lactate permease [Corynebacterium sp.]
MSSTYLPDLAPVADNLFLSSLVALLPLATVFVTLGVLRWRAHWAGLSALAVSLVIAVAVYGMPVHLAGLSATQGAVFGLFPIMWIVVAAIWFYELTVRSGRFLDLRAVIDRISDDPRVQAILIAFCFGGMLEALAGFGAPLAITGVMLLAVGFARMRAAVAVLIANTAPVAFGAIATPIITAGALTGIDYEHIGAIVGRQTPFIAVFVPLFLCLLVDGKKGLKQCWPIALVIGAVFAVVQFISSNYISVELTDIISALAGLAVAVVMLQFWRPAGTAEARERLLTERREEEENGEVQDVTSTDNAHAAAAGGAEVVTRELTTSRTLMALFPYLLVIVIFSVAKLWDPVVDFLASTDVSIPWPGLDGNVLTADGSVSSSTVYGFPWLSSPGTLLMITGVIVAAVYRVSPKVAVQAYWENLVKMRFSILTVAAVLSLAYVMNQSGQTITIGHWIAGAGAAFAFFAPVLGWLGTAVTGSDTSANALFATLQQTAANQAGLDPALMVASNTSGGVVAKLVSPQNLTIVATAVGLAGRESEILRKVMWWSIGMLAAICLINGLQATVLDWMIP